MGGSTSLPVRSSPFGIADQVPLGQSLEVIAGQFSLSRRVEVPVYVQCQPDDE
jgi:hypothetical protein